MSLFKKILDTATGRSFSRQVADNPSDRPGAKLGSKILHRLGNGAKTLFRRHVETPLEPAPAPAGGPEGYAETEDGSFVAATCPACQHEFRLSPDSSFDSQSTVSCPSCKKWFELTAENTKTVKPAPADPKSAPSPASASAAATVPAKTMTLWQASVEQAKARALGATPLEAELHRLQAQTSATALARLDPTKAISDAADAFAFQAGVAAAQAGPVRAGAPMRRQNIVSLKSAVMVANPLARKVEELKPRRSETPIEFLERRIAHDMGLQDSAKIMAEPAGEPAEIDLNACINSAELWQRARGFPTECRSAWAIACDAHLKEKVESNKGKGITIYVPVTEQLAAKRAAQAKVSPRALHAAALANAAV
jgi:hypothetical protein